MANHGRNLIVAGSNPNGGPVLITEGISYPRFVYSPCTVAAPRAYTIISECRVEYLDPPYMAMERPTATGFPKRIDYNTEFTVNVTIPANLNKKNIKGESARTYSLRDHTLNPFNSFLDRSWVFDPRFPSELPPRLYGRSIVPERNEIDYPEPTEQSCLSSWPRYVTVL